VALKYLVKTPTALRAEDGPGPIFAADPVLLGRGVGKVWNRTGTRATDGCWRSLKVVRNFKE
jgi:hypothetical protein